MKSWQLNRRTFLRGSGIALPLPFLNAMSFGATKDPSKVLPKRAAFIFFPNGVSMPKQGSADYDQWHWWPKGEGRDFEFRYNLEALNPFRKDLSVISGLSNPLNRKMDPHKAPAGFLTTAQIVKGVTKAQSISIDQVICEHMGRQTQLSSMVLSTAGGTGSATAPKTLSFDKSGKGIPAMSNLRGIYRRMYLSNSPEAKARLEKQDRLLNEVYQSAKDIKRRLGSEDQETLEEYLTSISELEEKVSKDKEWLGKSNTKPPEMELNVTYKDPEKYIRTMYELIYLAFKSDITRVAAYQIAQEGATAENQMSLFAGLSKEVHALSHGRATNAFEEWGKWDKFLGEQLAYLIQRLKDSREGEGSLLDRSLIFHGSGTSRSHYNWNYPLILAGGQQMGHRSGQYLKYEEEKHALANLYVEIAQRMEVPIKEFGDSTGISMSELFS